MTLFGPPTQQYPKKGLADRWHNVSGLLWDLVRPRWARLALGLLMVMIGRAAALALPASTKYLVDTVILQRNADRLLPLVLLLFTATLIQAGCSFLVSIIVSAEGHRLVAELRWRVQEHVCRLPVNFFDSNKAGTLSSRIISDVEGTRHLMGYTLVEYVGGIVTAMFSLIYLLRVNVTLTGTALLSLVLYSFVSKQSFKRIRNVFREGTVVQAEVSGGSSSLCWGFAWLRAIMPKSKRHASFPRAWIRC